MLEALFKSNIQPQSKPRVHTKRHSSTLTSEACGKKIEHIELEQDRKALLVDEDIR